MRAWEHGQGAAQNRVDVTALRLRDISPFGVKGYHPVTSECFLARADMRALTTSGLSGLFDTQEPRHKVER